ncbi:glycosyltransferase [Saccharopolyspora rosea]|uniref:Macrolide family glycosyltransferase n=1 Tax=Saccharopolyspora rosea TaxID=524884 RepID=A0ABW3G1B1_9PSEU
MHLLFTSVPAHGHVNPTLPLVRELVRRGHRVSYAVHEEFRSVVEPTGATVLPVPGEMPKTPMRFEPESMRRRMTEFERMIRDGLAELDRVLRHDPPDALCYDAMTLSARIAVRRFGVPGVALFPSYASHEGFSLREELMSSGSGFPPEFRRVLEAMWEQTADLAAEAGVERFDPMSTPPDELNIVFIPREFQFAGDTFDERFHFVGPSLGEREDAGDWRPPADGRLLFVSLGTAFNYRPEFFRMCLDAFGDTDWHVAMAVGKHIDVDGLGAVPANVEIRPFFPQPAVLRHADVFLSHTGMNSTMESLSLGVPLVAVPQQPEQAANARQVDGLGLGRHLDPASLSPELLRKTVEEVHADPHIRANVARMSATLRAADAPARAADAIEAHLA